MSVKELIALGCGLLPASRIKNRLLVLLGHSVDASSTIKPVFLLGSTRVRTGPNSRLGSLNVIRNVQLSLASDAVIGQLNWISSAPFLVQSSESVESGRLELGAHASIMNRHYIDCSGGLILGPYSILAGVRSTVMSHGIDVGLNKLIARPIKIGDYAMVGGNSNLVLGAEVPSHSLVAMGSTVVRGLTETRAFYAGTPAKYRKAVEGEFFHRAQGEVLPMKNTTSSNITED